AENTPAAASELSPRASTASWSNRELAAELVLAGVEMRSLASAQSWARAGIGGIVLFGTPSQSLRSQLAAVRAASPGGRILVSSDEEGGIVQRLTRLLGAMPSARQVGATLTTTQARELSGHYGSAMRELGVNVSLAPVADVGVRRSYIYREGRSFSTDPSRAALFVRAWMQGLSDNSVMSVVKHWPGHGSAANTHIGSGRTARWSRMLTRDEVPFTAAFAAGAPAVMVGHLIVPGLTGSSTPATMSKRAMSYLRKASGPNTLIITDALTMGAVTSAMHQTPEQAAVRSLAAGCDFALINTANPMKAVRAIERAIRDGRLPRAQAIASANRVLAAQNRWQVSSPSGS
ncbi:MAG: glycoside hydrolase family 3 N-terminal domain-containing protein, partial [Actinomycetes bacterium]